MDIKDVLITNYLPYAKGTIIGRAIPGIDGLKPSQRRILYTMYNMGLLTKDKMKSSNVVGQTMKVHPHGDSSIYESVINMSVGNERLNVPYVDSKGNFGKVYSESLSYAAARYTECKLAAICKEMFDGIDEDAVEMVDNFDGTMKEPLFLPVKFPSILVNPSNGIAVGMSSSIPSFSLTNACKSVIGILKGEIKTAHDLMQVLGVPEYSTGGHIHADAAMLTQLGETGKGSFIMSGTVATYPDKIVITEIPYRTTAEAIVTAIEENVKAGELKEVVDVSDEIDLKGFRLVVMLKARANPAQVLQKLVRLTPLRMSMSFNTRVIVEDRCLEAGLLEVLNKWIDFRINTIHRVYTFRNEKAYVDKRLLESWEKIKLDIREVAQLIASKTEENAKIALMNHYKLDEVQVEYLLDTKIRQFTEDNLNKKMAELNKVRNNIAEYEGILATDNAKYKLIIEDQERIIKLYGKPNKTQVAPPIVELPTIEEEEKVDDALVTVILTKSGYLKRLVTLRDITNYELPDDEEQQARWSIRNNEHILVFTCDGTVHKIPVNCIDAGRGQLKDQAYKLVGLPNKNDILLIDEAGDYTKYFNLVYPNGRGTRVYYNKASGNRKKYKGLFDACTPGNVWFTFSDQFFMITVKRKAALCNLEMMGILSTRVAFKAARVNSGDKILLLQPIENVKNIEDIDISRYKKEYTVCINDDIIWDDPDKKVDIDDVAEDTSVTSSDVV